MIRAELLPATPALSSDDAIEIADRRRNQIWGASLNLDELADLDVRIAAASRSG